MSNYSSETPEAEGTLASDEALQALLREHGVEEVVYLQAVGSNDFRVAAFPREMGITEDDFVMVSHAIHRF